jgi:hypothetical protein
MPATTTTPRTLTFTKKARDIQANDLLDVDGTPVRVSTVRSALTPRNIWQITVTTDGAGVITFRGADIRDHAVLMHAAVPAIGDGATLAVGSDSYPYTVVSVSASGKQITVQADDTRIVFGSFASGDAQVRYSRNTDGGTRVLRWSARFGRWVPQGGGRPAHFGTRCLYRDPSF